jgi:serine/threonine protein kinase
MQSIKFPEATTASMVKDLANALQYLHSRKIVHRDLKPENVMVRIVKLVVRSEIAKFYKI